MTASRQAVIALATGLALLAAPSAPAEDATPPALEQHPFHREYVQDRVRRELVDRAIALNPRSQLKPRASNPLDLRAYDLDVTLDPITGATQVKATVRIGAVGAVDELQLLIDRGLAIGAITVSTGQTATAVEYPYPPWNYVIIQVSPPIPAGTEADVVIDYAGTLLCLPASTAASGECLIGPDRFLYFNQGSFLPLLLDGNNGWGDDRMTKAVTLKVPTGSAFTASGTLVTDTDDGTTRTMRWEIPHAMPAWYSFLFIGGEVSEQSIPGASVPASLWFETGGTQWNPELTEWTPSVLAFLDAQAGAPLPYGILNGIKIPKAAKFVGTVGYGMTLLADTYAGFGPEYFEETWAHENAHQWWATVVTPSDYELSRLLTEGLATFTQYDYTAQRHHADVPRDEYLYRRHHEADLLLRYRAPGLPALVVNRNDQPSSQMGYTVWAYFKGAALLDHLRVTVGEDAFAAGLQKYAAECAFTPCGTDDFRARLEAASGVDLAPFFERFVFGTDTVGLVLGFEQVPAAGGGHDVQVTLARDPGAPVRLELWLEQEDGALIRKHVTLADTITTLTEHVEGKVRRVRPNPRHHVFIHAQAELPGDLDFDGATDGIDVLRCAFLEGRNVRIQPSAASLYGVDVAFEPRCDPDGDGVVEPHEVDALAASMGPGVTP